MVVARAPTSRYISRNQSAYRNDKKQDALRFRPAGLAASLCVSGTEVSTRAKRNRSARLLPTKNRDTWMRCCPRQSHGVKPAATLGTRRTSRIFCGKSCNGHLPDSAGRAENSGRAGFEKKPEKNLQPACCRRLRCVLIMRTIQLIGVHVPVSGPGPILSRASLLCGFPTIDGSLGQAALGSVPGCSYRSFDRGLESIGPC